jgi:hypothetical protein
MKSLLTAAAVLAWLLFVVVPAALCAGAREAWLKRRLGPDYEGPLED